MRARAESDFGMLAEDVVNLLAFVESLEARIAKKNDFFRRLYRRLKARESEQTDAGVLPACLELVVEGGKA
jgi:hypothetical protein